MMTKLVSRWAATAALAVAGLASVPAAANPTAANDVCQGAPQALRPLAAAVEPAVQRRALRNIALGEALCEARNRSEASRKFALAARDLGTSLELAMAGRTTAAAQ